MIRRLFLLLLLSTTSSWSVQTGQFTRIAMMGDSITAQTGAQDGSAFNRNGLWSNLSCNLGQQVELVFNGSTPYFATGGQNSAYIEAVHLPQVLATNAEACFVLAGINDGGASVEPSRTNLTTICKTLADHGITPILCDLLPVRSDYSSRAPWILAMRQVIKEICDGDPRFIHCDWESVLDTNGDGMVDQDWYLYDTVHPDADAMSRLGAYAATVIRPYIRSGDIFTGITWVTPNPTLSGSGLIPDGWAFDVSTGGVATQKLIPRGGTLGNWWQISVANADATRSSAVRYATTAPGGTWQPGDAVDFIIEFQTDSDVSGTWNMTPALAVQPSSLLRRDSVIDGTVVTGAQRVAAGILHTPPVIIPAGTTSFSFFLNVVGTGTFRIGRVGVRKVPLTFYNWITGFRGLTDMTPGGDPDGDGIPNQLEWVLGGDPSVKDASSLKSYTLASGWSDFSFRINSRSIADSGLELRFSQDLVNWTEFPVGPGAIGSSVALIPDFSDATRWHSYSPQTRAGFFSLKSVWK